MNVLHLVLPCLTLALSAKDPTEVCLAKCTKKFILCSGRAGISAVELLRCEQERLRCQLGCAEKYDGIVETPREDFLNDDPTPTLQPNKLPKKDHKS